MAVNRSSAPRTDFPFLSRRVKPRPAPPAQPAPAAAAPAPARPSTPPPSAAAPAAPAPPPRTTPAPATTPTTPPPGSLTLSSPSRPAAGPPPVTTSLSLGNSREPAPAAGPPSRPGAAAGQGRVAAGTPQRRVPLHTKLFPAPGMQEVRTLDKQNPVVRLTPMESAVGTLAVAGSMRAVWEAADFRTGSVSSGELRRENLSGVVVDTPGNRPVVGYEEELALIPLRRSSMLRRALFFPKPKQPMSVGIYNGRSLTVPAKAGERSFYVLSVLRIGNVLELRAEVIPYGMELKAIWEAFGFTMSSEFPFRGN
ncbi:hypothetical protein LJ756_14560 [Arthrobacter sp. zg-Y411]|uniref:hypothetical protein n=1 Tax=Arthrobacter zhangbolii TaxID=2886936 RepID=UPI001D14E972|nr:hypothetical protein [Arthrobacter zhangbolii]MCC3295839.1 hypothetical protein [Arthrobacter zhangbolii]